MTRKDYIAIAKVLKENAENYSDSVEATNAIEAIAGQLAAVCAADNPNFNPKQFFTACGLYTGK